MLVTRTDLIVADQSHSAQGRVHFINAHGGTIARQFIGNNDAWDILTLLEELTKESLRGHFVSPTLHENIQHIAILIDCSPEVVALTMNRQEDFVQVPLAARPGTTAPELIGIPLADLPAPLPDRLIGHGNPAGKEPFLDVPIAEAKPVIEPRAVADHLCGNAVMCVAVGRGRGVQAAMMPHAPEVVETPGLS
jgi:hypothetical protein